MILFAANAIPFFNIDIGNICLEYRRFFNWQQHTFVDYFELKPLINSFGSDDVVDVVPNDRTLPE